jgi:hypothetical protein
MYWISHKRPKLSRRGSALSLAIVVSVILSSLIAALAYVAGQTSQATGAISKMDQAFYTAESGAQRLAWFARNRTIGTLTSPMTGTVNGYTYSVSWPQGTNDGAQITSTSTAVSGLGSYTLSVFCSPSFAPAPAFTSFGNFDNKNTQITGDVATSGNYSNGGSGSLTGDVYYGGTGTSLNGVTGIVYPSASFPALDFAALDTTLRATTITMLNTVPVYDFSLAPGANKVIYVVGDVTDPSITGSGTLYVKGKVHFSNPNVTVGSAAKPVNIVATDDITFDKAATYYGGLYSAKNINRAQLDLYGSIYAGAAIGPSNSGVSHFTVTAMPWFDTRTVANGSTTLTFSNFTGIAP